MLVSKKKDLHRRKTRIFIFLFVIVGIVLLALGIWRYRFQTARLHIGDANISSAPNIESLPGSGNPSAEYVQLQERQNNIGSNQAKTKGTSFVPTLVRQDFMGSSDKFVPHSLDPHAAHLKCPLPSGHLHTVNPDVCTPIHLKRARKAGVRVEELMCQSCSCRQLHDDGGYTIGELKNAGFLAKELRDCGFSLEDLIRVGFSAKKLKDAGFTAGQLKDAGFTVAQLKDAGFTAGQLKDAGFTAGQLKDAGFTAEQLKEAGFTAGQLKDAGFSAAALRAGKFSDPVLKAAGFSTKVLRAALETDSHNDSIHSCDPVVLRQARLKGISLFALKRRHCKVSQLKASDFSAHKLKQAGYSSVSLRTAGFSGKALKAAGFSAKDLYGAGFSPRELKDASFSAEALDRAGLTAAQLKEAGFDAAAVKSLGLTAAQLRDAGFSASALKKAGFASDQLGAAGYTRGDLLRAGYMIQSQQHPISSEGDGGDNGALNNRHTKTGLSKQAIDDFVDSNADHFRHSNMASMPIMNSPEDRLRALQKMEQETLNQEQRRAMQEEIQGQMMVQAQLLLKDWGSYQKQRYQKGIDSSAKGVNVNALGEPIQPAAFVKAGSIMFAVLNTAINSDEPSPVLATILSGRLKGSKLIGSFVRVNEAVLIRFTRINIPRVDHTFAINAVAIDPNTAHTALADHVSRHLLLRYAGLFAATFISGVAQGITQPEAIDCFLGIFCHEKKKKLKVGDYALLGLGEVGKKTADVFANQIDRAPTIKVDAGGGIGLLFMADVEFPQTIVVAKKQGGGHDK